MLEGPVSPLSSIVVSNTGGESSVAALRGVEERETTPAPAMQADLGQHEGDV